MTRLAEYLLARIQKKSTHGNSSSSFSGTGVHEGTGGKVKDWYFLIMFLKIY